jgi:hypothetical protein
VLADKLRKSDYAHLAGRILREPCHPNEQPRVRTH